MDFCERKTNKFLTPKTAVMKNKLTIKSADTSKRSFRRTLILSIVCLMLPGCVTHTDTCDIVNGRWFPAYVLYNAAYGNGTTEQPGNSIKKIVINNIDKNNPANGCTTSVETDNIPAANNVDTDPLQSVMAENRIDQHDTSDEEKVIKIKFPPLMRIAIMMLLIVLII